MSKTRKNHYVPEWHQKGFLSNDKNQLLYLTLEARHYQRADGTTKIHYQKTWCAPSQCFYQTDLYTTFFEGHSNDEIERKLFGPIDDAGSVAVRAFAVDDQLQMQKSFEELFSYLDAQKLRTPKGLCWIKNHYPKLKHIGLMTEMQAIRKLHCTLWAEGVHEIVSCTDSCVKFIISDHPVTIYNYACPPESELCNEISDPDIALKASQTIYPLDKDHLLILTNLEYAQDPVGTNPTEQRTNPTKVRQTIVRTDSVIRTRSLNNEDVQKINLIIKSRAKKFIGAGKDEWLYPEVAIKCEWADLRSVLIPPRDKVPNPGGKTYVRYEDGSTHYQDEFGRTSHLNSYLNKQSDKHKIGRNDFCGCGSGNKFKSCCRPIPTELRTTWKVLSIRERNLALYSAIYDILGLNYKTSTNLAGSRQLTWPV